jgi:hypothetical protein
MLFGGGEFLISQVRSTMNVLRALGNPASTGLMAATADLRVSILPCPDSDFMSKKGCLEALFAQLPVD